MYRCRGGGLVEPLNVSHGHAETYRTFSAGTRETSSALRVLPFVESRSRHGNLCAAVTLFPTDSFRCIRVPECAGERGCGAFGLCDKLCCHIYSMLVVLSEGGQLTAATCVPTRTVEENGLDYKKAVGWHAIPIPRMFSRFDNITSSRVFTLLLPGGSSIYMIMFCAGRPCPCWYYLRHLHARCIRYY